MANHMKSVFYGVRDLSAFCGTVQTLINQITVQDGVFVGDNLISFNRNLSFLDDAKMMAAIDEHAETEVEQSVIWRTHLLCWCARRAMALDGDLVECACYRGTSARILADYVDFADSDKTMWLYDLFVHDAETQRHLSMARHGEGLFEKVKARFAGFPNVRVVQGEVPAVLDEHAPERIAHLHLDLNDATAELGTLEFFFDRVTPGGTIVFDDYGWLAYREQKLAEDAFLAERGYQVLELPTGQGLVIK